LCFIASEASRIFDFLFPWAGLQSIDRKLRVRDGKINGK